MAQYQIQAQVETIGNPEEFTGSSGRPTFWVEAISEANARKIGEAVLNPRDDEVVHYTIAAVADIYIDQRREQT
jgi:hypothetical protein